MKKIILTVAIAGLGLTAMAQNVGVGTTAPTNKLHVAGDVRIETIAPGAATDKILVADANGVVNDSGKTVADVVTDAVAKEPWRNTDGTAATDASTDINYMNGSVGINTTTPDASAQLDVTSATKGFLPPRVADVTVVTNPAAGLQVYDISNNCMRYYNGTTWSLCMGEDNSGQVASSTSCGGKIWMSKNLGATQVATSSTDAAAYGDLYQWGRATDGHEKRTSTVLALGNTVTSATPGHGDFIPADATTDFNWTDFATEDDLWQGVNGINNPCPTGYRLPTDAEWDCERTSWTTNDAAGAFASPLKLSVAGARYFSDGLLIFVGTYGYYWSSTVSGTSANYLLFYSGDASITNSTRTSGFSVRCLKD